MQAWRHGVVELSCRREQSQSDRKDRHMSCDRTERTVTCPVTASLDCPATEYLIIAACLLPALELCSRLILNFNWFA